MILPSICLLASIGCFWCYNVSGLAQHTQTTFSTLAEVIPMADPTQEQMQRQDQQNELLGIPTVQLFSAFAKTKAINYMSEEEKQKFLDNAIEEYAGPFIDQEQRPLFKNLLSIYYLSGPSKASFNIWDYAISYPIDNFNRNAQTNNAYSFLVVLLFVLAGLNCVGGILFKEDL